MTVYLARFNGDVLGVFGTAADAFAMFATRWPRHDFVRRPNAGGLGLTFDLRYPLTGDHTATATVEPWDVQ